MTEPGESRNSASSRGVLSFAISCLHCAGAITAPIRRGSRVRNGGNRSPGRVAYGFDVVAVGIEHEGAVIIRVVMGADAGRPVIASARGHRRLVESVNGGAVLRNDGDMQRLVQSAFAADPEIRLAIGAKTGRGIMSGLFLRYFHDEAVAKRRQRLCVESLRALIIGNRKTDVVDHQYLLRFEGWFSRAPIACCCGSCRSWRSRTRACRQCSRRAIRSATNARSPPRAARALAALV